MKRRAAVGQRYYEADHDIKHCRFFYFNDDDKIIEDKYRANVKISHPFFTELVDQLPPYMLSFKENPIRAKENIEGLQEHLDSYFDARFWAEIGDLIAGAYTKGFEYLYALKNEDNRLVFECADSMGVVEVRAKDTDDGCKYIIYWYIDRIDKGKKTIKRIQVWGEKDVSFYVQSGNGRIVKDESETINPRPHVVFTDPETKKKMGKGLGYIPFWRLDNNKKRFSGLKPIKDLIDDYDRMQCGLSNNLVDFDLPLYVVNGFEGDNLDKLQHNLKTKKIIGIPDAEGGVTVNTVNIPYEARRAKAEDDEKNIYRFGMGLNTLGLKDSNATTNMMIRAAYSLLEMKASNLTKRLEALLDSVIEIVLDEINAENKTAFKCADVEICFERSTPANEKENADIEKVKAETRKTEIETILEIAAYIGDDETLKSICDVLDLDYKEVKSAIEREAENSLENAKMALDNIPVENQGDVIEQATENSTNAIPE